MSSEHLEHHAEHHPFPGARPVTDTTADAEPAAGTFAKPNANAASASVV